MTKYLHLNNPGSKKIIDKIENAAKRLSDGKMVIMVDDEDRENEGDLVYAAEKSTPELVNFMAKYGRGLICLSMTNDMADNLELPLMVEDNQSKFGTGFTISIEATIGVTTGISAKDRSTTILAAVKDGATAADLSRPGHIFPLRARNGGVLVRTGQTEGSSDLAKIARLKPSGVICEIMNDDGTMSRMPELEQFSKKHGIPIISVADIVAYRLLTESLIENIAESNLPTRFGGNFSIKIFKSKIDNLEHVVLYKGDISDVNDPVLVRVHSECLTGDALGSMRCDCGFQLSNAMKMIEDENRGVVVYLRQEGRGIGLGNKIKAYHLQDHGMDTVEANEALGFAADLRDYGIGAQILLELGIRRIKLMTNNPKKFVSLKGYGLEVIEQVPIIAGVNDNNIGYLKTKQEKLGHKLFIQEKQEEKNENK